MKKILCILIITFFIFSLTGCTSNDYDEIRIINKSIYVFDDINIKVKEGYYYDRHEKFTIDDNTIGVTIYFSGIDNWNEPVEE